MKTAAASARCPAGIINGTPAERIEHFKKFLANHHHLATAYREAMGAINRSTGPRVVIVAGPTGVGKSTMARQIYKQLRQTYADEIAKDRGFVPVMGISAVPPNGSNFNWKDFYIRMLTSHGDVMVDRKLFIPRQSEIFSDTSVPSHLERSVTEALRRSLENSLRQRRTRVLIIDEAHHMLMVKDPSRLEYQFEALKSLTIETDVTIVLVGTYRLLDIRDQSGQLVRRSEIINLPRYDVRKRQDAAAFASLVRTLTQQLPFEEVPDFQSDLDYVYAKSAGCTGILKDWLSKCTEHAIAAGKKTIALADLDKLALPNKSLRTIIEEALYGERKLEDEDIGGINDLLHRGIPAIAEDAANRQRRRPRRIGERNPVRDPVGGVRHVAA